MLRRSRSGKAWSKKAEGPLSLPQSGVPTGRSGAGVDGNAMPGSLAAAAKGEAVSRAPEGLIIFYQINVL